jgi:hypothetical protein
MVATGDALLFRPKHMPPDEPKTFADLFCEQNGVPASEFPRALVEHALPPEAHALRRLLQLMPGDYFADDLAFAQNIGRLTRAEDFAWALAEFHAHPSNRRTLRRQLRVRLSIPRLRRIVQRTFAESELSHEVACVA